MVLKTVTEAGFYNGRFLRPGASYEAGEVKIDRLNKGQLLALAAERGVEVDASKTKAEIIAAIEAKAVEGSAD
ncbi:hypothetical protein NBH19_08890 [Rhizobium sp. S95]|uniref:Uncharacterized protein n=1 Tax=Ciceribacter sichuanensis TaxID=2949647 RepID=A0AAJ1BWM9_9HYPH|nr:MULTISPECIES: hypothetical protein [unclassified Ciceribacter]MCM2396193.1 hypothetical protein [Ciceribacter sp. S95]MCO5957656.1 hypothetical protein [Ciceribacter sp. S101]